MYKSNREKILQNYYPPSYFSRNADLKNDTLMKSNIGTKNSNILYACNTNFNYQGSGLKVMTVPRGVSFYKAMRNINCNKILNTRDIKNTLSRNHVWLSNYVSASNYGGAYMNNCDPTYTDVFAYTTQRKLRIVDLQDVNTIKTILNKIAVLSKPFLLPHDPPHETDANGLIKVDPDFWNNNKTFSNQYVEVLSNRSPSTAYNAVMVATGYNVTWEEQKTKALDIFRRDIRNDTEHTDAMFTLMDGSKTDNIEHVYGGKKTQLCRYSYGLTDNIVADVIKALYPSLDGFYALTVPSLCYNNTLQAEICLFGAHSAIERDISSVIDVCNSRDNASYFTGYICEYLNMIYEHKLTEKNDVEIEAIFMNLRSSGTPPNAYHMLKTKGNPSAGGSKKNKKNKNKFIFHDK